MIPALNHMVNTVNKVKNLRNISFFLDNAYAILVEKAILIRTPNAV